MIYCGATSSVWNIKNAPRLAFSTRLAHTGMTVSKKVPNTKPTKTFKATDKIFSTNSLYALTAAWYIYNT